MSRHIALSLVFCLLAGCQFTTDRSFGTGELKGRLVFQNAEGNKVPAEGAVIQLQGTRLSVTSDAKGQFSFRGLTAATYALKVAYNIDPQDATKGSGLLLPRVDLSHDNGGGVDLGTVVLQRLAALDGTVRLNREPLANARVVVASVGQRYSSATGTFSFDGLFPVQSDHADDASTVTAFVTFEDGTVAAKKTFTLTPGGRTTADLDIDPNAERILPTTVSGTASLTEGSDPGDMTVQLFADGHALPIADTTTSSDGLFVLTNVPAGVYTVVVSNDGYLSVEVPFVVVAGEPLSLPDLVLSRGSGTPCGRDTGTTNCDPPLPPRVSEVVPADGATGVPRDTSIRVTLSQHVDPTTVTASSVRLFSPRSGDVLGTVSAADNTITFTPAGLLGPSARYTFELSPTIRSTDGQPVLSALQISFTTGNTASEFALTGSSPVNGATDVPVNTTTISAFFSSAVSTATSETDVALLDAKDNVVPGKVVPTGSTVSYELDGQVGHLEPDRTYTLKFYPSFRAADGRMLTGAQSISFTTASRPFQILSTTPYNGEKNVPVSTRKLRVAFTEPPASTTTPADITLITPESVELQGTVSINANELTYELSGQVQLDYNTVYTLSFKNSFRSESGKTLENQQGFVFTTAGIPFELVSSVPTNGATGISHHTTSFTAQFSDPIAPTLGPTDVLLLENGVSVLFGSTTVNGNSVTYTLDPGVQLKLNTAYTLFFNPSFAAAAGRTITGNQSVNFTTVDAAFEITDSSPSANAVNVDADPTRFVTVTFSEDIDATMSNADVTFVNDQAQLLPGIVTVEGNELTYMLQQGTQLQLNTTYTLSFQPTFKAASGRSLTGAQQVSFKTSTTSPLMFTVTPADNEQQADTFNVKATFNQPMDAQSINATSFFVQDTQGNTVPVSYSYDATANRMTLIVMLKYSTFYVATLTTGIQTANGKSLVSDYTWYFTTQDQPPARSLAVGAKHTCMVLQDSRLYCFGHNESGQLGTGDTNVHADPAFAGASWKSVAASDHNTCAIDLSSGLACWGDEQYGTVGNGAPTGTSNPQVQPSYLPGLWRSLSMGGNHACGVRSDAGFDGTLWCWGDNSSFQGGRTAPALLNVPTQVGTDTNWTEVSLGESHTCALKSDDSLYCWGRSAEGQLGVTLVDGGSGTPPQDQPQQVSGAWGFVSAGRSHTCAIDLTGALTCWGLNTDKQLGVPLNPGDTKAMTPQLLPAPQSGGTWVSVTAGATHSCAIDSNSKLACWGGNTFGELGTGNQYTVAAPYSPTNDNWTLIVAGTHRTCGVNVSYPRTACWGTNEGGGNGNGKNVPIVPTAASVTSSNGVWSKMALGANHTCAISSAGTLSCWGDNSKGQLGNDGVPFANEPFPVGVATDWVEIAAGGNNTCGIRFNGTSRNLLCWGANESEQVGYHSVAQAPYNTPVVVGSTGDFVSVAVGESHTCALRTGGIVQCWGSNKAGQLGAGVIETASPGRTYSNASTLSPWASVSVGTGFTCLTDASGNVSCVGDNARGALGRGIISASESDLVPVVGSHVCSKLGIGGAFACGLTNQSTVACWGSNDAGAVGNNSSASTGTPAVLSGNDWSLLTAGNSHACGLRGVDETWCWGSNKGGQFGDSTIAYGHATDQYPTPRLAVSGHAFVNLQGGGDHTCGLKADGTLLCWGSNTWGQIGVGGVWQAGPLAILVK